MSRRVGVGRWEPQDDAASGFDYAQRRKGAKKDAKSDYEDEDEIEDDSACATKLSKS